MTWKEMFESEKGYLPGSTLDHWGEYIVWLENKLDEYKEIE